MSNQKDTRLNVLLVCYNNGKYIEECVNSILMQKTNFKFNVIVADDKTPDDSVDKVKKLSARSDIEFVFIECKENLGHAGNYMRGFKACDAEYIAVMDGDDFWTDPHRLQKHVDLLDNHPEYAMSSNNRINANYEKSIFIPRYKTGAYGFPIYKDFINGSSYLRLSIKNVITSGLGGNFSTCIYRKSIIDKLPPDFLLSGLDPWMNILVCMNGFMAYFTETMSTYRIHNASLMGNKSQYKKLQHTAKRIDQYNRKTYYMFDKEFSKRKKRLLKKLAIIERGLNFTEIHESDVKDEFLITEENQSLENFQNSIKDKKLVLFGASETCMRFINNCLQSSEQAAYICDNNPTRHGEKLLGIKIVSPDVLQTENKENTVVVLCTGKSNLEISWQARGFVKFAAKTVMNARFTDRANYFAAHKEKFTQIKDLLCDDHSKRVWDILNINSRYGITDFSEINSNQPLYLPDCLFFSALSDKEIVVDAGVLDGTNTKTFCDFFGKRLAKLYALEPVEASFNLSNKNLASYYAKGYPVSLIKCGLLDTEEQVEMMVLGTSGRAGIPGLVKMPFSETYANFEKETVSVRPLDDIIPPEEKVTYIKMDIEGAEYKALLGAKRIIREHKPRLAICLYHKEEDYFNIPLLIKQFVPEYKFYLRHHSKNLYETVLYATL